MEYIFIFILISLILVIRLWPITFVAKIPWRLAMIRRSWDETLLWSYF